MKKALYCLRQASRAWFDKLKSFFLSIGFIGSKSDASLFIQCTNNTSMFVLIYVDDIIITGSVSRETNEFVSLLHVQFSLKDMGDIYFFLGVEVQRLCVGSLHLCQRKYMLDLLDQCNLLNDKSVTTPMVSSSYLSKDFGSPIPDPSEYRSIVGVL